MLKKISVIVLFNWVCVSFFAIDSRAVTCIDTYKATPFPRNFSEFLHSEFSVDIPDACFILGTYGILHCTTDRRTAAIATASVAFTLKLKKVLEYNTTIQRSWERVHIFSILTSAVQNSNNIQLQNFKNAVVQKIMATDLSQTGITFADSSSQNLHSLLDTQIENTLVIFNNFICDPRYESQFSRYNLLSKTGWVDLVTLSILAHLRAAPRAITK